MIRIPFSVISLLFILHSELFSQTGGWMVPSGDDFPIAGYCINYSDTPNDSTFKVLENGGINLLINFNKTWDADAQAVYNGLNSYRLKYPSSKLKMILVLQNQDLTGIHENPHDNNDIDTFFNFYASNSIYGYSVWDEPWDIVHDDPHDSKKYKNNDLAAINHIMTRMRANKNSRSRLAFVNLMPMYWNITNNNETRYKQYIDHYISSLSSSNKPQLLSMDYYPFLTRGRIRNTYFQNLAILKEKSLQYNIPFWVIILSSQHDSYIDPTIGQIRMQVYSSLAYGAKGIGYYLYTLVPSWVHTAILQYNYDKPSGYHGHNYQDVKNLNSEIKFLGPVLLKLTPIAVYHNDTNPNGQQKIDYDWLNNSKRVATIIDTIHGTGSRYAMVGYFKHQHTNENYILVVNKNYDTDENFTINLMNSALKIYEISKTTGLEVLIGSDTKSIPVNLEAGSGRLFKF